MKEQDIIRYKSIGIEQLAKELHDKYYTTILQLSDAAYTLALQLRVEEIDEPVTTDIYTVLCINFTRQLRQYQQQKISTVLPYIFSLSEKEKKNHNCVNCNHNCQVNHTMYIALLRESHEMLRPYLYRLHNVSVATNNNIDDELHKSLKEKMFLIEQYLLESIFIEESILITQILAVQKAINVQT